MTLSKKCLWAPLGEYLHLDSNQEHTSRYIRGSRLAALSMLAYTGGIETLRFELTARFYGSCHLPIGWAFRLRRAGMYVAGAADKEI